MDKNSRFYFYGLNLGIPILIALFIFICFDLTHLDILISNLFIDSKTNLFIFRHNDLFELLTHKWPRLIINSVGAIVVILFLFSLIWDLVIKIKCKYIQYIKNSKLGNWFNKTIKYRKDFFYIIVSITVATTIIHYFKSHTGIYCPIDLKIYGGQENYATWFHQFNLFHKYPNGRCWPGGHASAGFTMLAFYFVAKHHQYKYRNYYLIFCFLLGLGFGFTKILQGQHFLSHNLWSGVFVWVSMFLIAIIFYGRKGLSNQNIDLYFK